jgi:hypothetical protein
MDSNGGTKATSKLKRCPKCGNRTLRFVSNDLAVGLVCDKNLCTYERVIQWK